MGLDITAHKNLIAPQDCEEVRDAAGDLKWDAGWHEVCLNNSFPSRGDGLQDGQVYKSEDSFGFRAGSYGGYNSWRDQLAKLAGYSNAQQCWATPEKSGPFYELINFSDCEGVIGPDTSKKLAEDFATFERMAGLHEDEWFRSKYQDWKKAFEFASENGCVDFH
jgi:hypothetical protein